MALPGPPQRQPLSPSPVRKKTAQELRPAAAGVAKLAARDSQLRVQMLLF